MKCFEDYLEVSDTDQNTSCSSCHCACM